MSTKQRIRKQSKADHKIWDTAERQTKDWQGTRAWFMPMRKKTEQAKTSCVEAFWGGELQSWDSWRMKLENQPHRSASVERRRSGMLHGKGAVTNFKRRWIFAMTDGEKSIFVWQQHSL